MEFKINEVQLPEKISFNYEELKQELQEKATLYASIVYGDDEIKQAKEDKAKLNKLKKALNDERIRREKEYMKPFNEFKAQVNEIIGIIDKPVNIIDSQVKTYEEKKKKEKLEKIQEYWESTEHPGWLKCNAIFDQKWLNTTFSMKKVQEAIDGQLAQIEADLKTLEALPEFSFEAVETYKQTLDINKAISEGQRLADIQRRKAEAEAAKAAEEKKLQEVAEEAAVHGVASAADIVDSAKALAEQIPPKSADSKWLRFEALLNVQQAKALKEFFETNNISFRAV